MKILRFERQEEAVAWAKQIIGIDGMTHGTAAVSLVDDQDQFVAVTVYSAYTPTNLDMHIAARPKSQWVSRSYFNAAFELPFVLLGVPRVTGLIRPKNRLARQFVKRLGFKMEGRMRKAFPDGDDVVLYGMLREEYFSHPWSNHEDNRIPAVFSRLPQPQGDRTAAADRSSDP